MPGQALVRKCIGITGCHLFVGLGPLLIGLHGVNVGSWKLVVLQLCLTPAISAYKSYVTLVPGIEQALSYHYMGCVSYADTSGY